jgi:hypothetical protein
VNVKQTLQEYRKEHILDLNHKKINSSLYNVNIFSQNLPAWFKTQGLPPRHAR